MSATSQARLSGSNTHNQRQRSQSRSRVSDSKKQLPRQDSKQPPKKQRPRQDVESNIKTLYSLASDNIKNKTANFIGTDQDGNILYYPKDPSVDKLKGVIFNKTRKTVCNNIPHIFEESYENQNIVNLNLDQNLSQYSIHPLIEGSCVRVWCDPEVYQNPTKQKNDSKQQILSERKWHQSTNRYIDGKGSNWKNQALNIENYLPAETDYNNFLAKLDPDYIYYFWISKDEESKNIVSYNGDAQCYFIFAQHRTFDKTIKDYSFKVVPNVKLEDFESLPSCDGYKCFDDIKKMIDTYQSELTTNYKKYLNSKETKNSEGITNAYNTNTEDLKTFAGFFLVNNNDGTCVKIVPNIFTEYRTAIGNEPTIYYRYLKVVKDESEDILDKFVFINYNKLPLLYNFLLKITEIKNTTGQSEYIKDDILKFDMNISGKNESVVIKKCSQYL